MTETPKWTKQPCPRCGHAESIVNPGWLRSERQQAGLTLREMARRLGFSAPYISDIEHGRRAALPKIVAAYEALR